MRLDFHCSYINFKLSLSVFVNEDLPTCSAKAADCSYIRPVVVTINCLVNSRKKGWPLSVLGQAHFKDLT